MKIHYSLERAGEIKNPVVTTGTFDGVHKGHQVIIRRLNKLARDCEGESVLITFHPHPRRVLYPDSKGRDLLLICSQEEKKILLAQTGLDHLVILEFNEEFSRISSKHFVEEYLVKKLNARIVVVGFNHQFGHNREGDFSYLNKLGRVHGFEVEEIPEQDIQNELVSSTRIRKALMEGNIQRANAYLDHYYLLKGSVSQDNDNSVLFNYPVYKIKIAEDLKLLPSNGIYAVSIECGSGLVKGLLNIDNWNITNSLMNPDIKVEFSFIDRNLYPEPGEITVYFHKKLRNQEDIEDPGQAKLNFWRDLQEVEELIY